MPFHLVDFGVGRHMAAKFRLNGGHFPLNGGDLSAQVFQHLFCRLALLFFAGYGIQPLILFFQFFFHSAQKSVDFNDTFSGSVLFGNIQLQLVAELFPLRNLSGNVAELPSGAGLFIHLDLLSQSGNCSVEGGNIIGLTHQRVQTGMDAACGSIHGQAVLIDEYAALERTGIKVEQGLADLIRGDSGCGSCIQVDDFHCVKTRRFTKGTDNPILHALGFKIKRAAVAAALPWKVASPFVFRDVLAAAGIVPVQHGFQKGCHRRFAPAVIVENHVQSIPKGIIVLMQTAKVIHMHADQFHSADTSFPLSAFHPRLIKRLRSDSLNDPS